MVSSSHRLKMIKLGIGRDADVVATCSSARILENLRPEHPIAKLIVQASKAHVTQFGDHGFMLIHLIAEYVYLPACIFEKLKLIPSSSVVLRATELQQSHSIPIDLLCHVIETCRDDIEEKFFNPGHHCSARIDMADWPALIQWLVQSVFLNNSLTRLQEQEAVHIATLVVKAFYASLPSIHQQMALQRFVPSVRYTRVPGVSVMQSCTMKNSVVIERDIPLEISHLIRSKQQKNELRLLIFERDLGGVLEQRVTSVSHQHLSIGIHKQGDHEEQDLLSLEVDNFMDMIDEILSQRVDIVASQRTIHPMLKQMMILKVCVVSIMKCKRISD